MHRMLISFALVVIANTAAWAAARIFGSRWDTPLDGGTLLPDGTRLLGSHKTWRGLIAAGVACECGPAPRCSGSISWRKQSCRWWYFDGR